MYVAITGTPGTGKTAAATILGRSVVSVRELAIEKGACSGPENDLEVDVKALSSELPGSEDLQMIEGHLAHWLPVSICIVLRCSPQTLGRRLKDRDYPEEKTRENMEAEAVDVILVEALENCEKVFEIDTTELDPEEVAGAIENVINGKGDEYLPGNVDWSQVVLDWY